MTGTRSSSGGRRTTVETVRILGIDTPETRHLEHNLPYAQSFGPEARGFAQGAFAAATQVELLRASTLDPYGRSLGYLFLNGRNYSVLVVQARLSAETVTFYGDNGLPERGGRGAGRGEGGRPGALRAPPRLPRPHEGRVEVDEGEGARGRAVGRARLKTPPRRLLLPLGLAAGSPRPLGHLRRLPLPPLRRLPPRDLARPRRRRHRRTNRLDRPQLRRGRGLPHPRRLAVPHPERGLPRKPALGGRFPAAGRTAHAGPVGDRGRRRLHPRGHARVRAHLVRLPLRPRRRRSCSWASPPG